jgi:hypothetical protein
MCSKDYSLFVQMDLFGSVDPYAIMFIEGSEYRSQTVKSSYTPEWNETFACDIMDITRGCRYDFIVQINDWDATNKDDEVGTFTVPAWRMTEIIRAKVGSEGEETFQLTLDGKAVVGHDKLPSEVTVKIHVEDLPLAFETLVVDPDAKGPRRIDVTVLSARHLPKIDILTGTCDPYALVFLPGLADFKTEVIKKTYSPDWDQAFSFDVPDVLDDCYSDLTLKIMDYDMLTKNDIVGSCVVPGFRITQLFRATDNWEATESFLLMNRGQAVRGYDGDLSVLTLRFRVYDIQRHVGLSITVLSASNLPCMEPLSRPWHHAKNLRAAKNAAPADEAHASNKPKSESKLPHSGQTDASKAEHEHVGTHDQGSKMDVPAVNQPKSGPHTAVVAEEDSGTRPETMHESASAEVTHSQREHGTTVPAAAAEHAQQGGHDAVAAAPGSKHTHNETQPHAQHVVKHPPEASTHAAQPADSESEPTNNAQRVVKHPTEASTHAVQPADSESEPAVNNSHADDTWEENSIAAAVLKHSVLDVTQMYTPSPYCWAQLGDRDACTSARHNAFVYDWKKEAMIIEVVEKAPLVVRLCDDDGTHLHDPMGEVILTLQQVASLIRGKDGYVEERMYDLLQDGEVVMGCDGQPARILLRIKVMDWGDKLDKMVESRSRRLVPHKVNR